MSSERDDRATEPGTLSPAGLARRDEMLGELMGSMRRLHRRRRSARRAISAAVFVTLVAGLSLLARPRPVAEEAPIAVVEESSEPEVPDASPRRINIELVRTDASVLARLATSPASRATELDDQALLSELAAMDRSAGLIRMGGRAWLTGNVTDPRGDDDRALPSS